MLRTTRFSLQTSHALKYSLHILIVWRQGKFRKRHRFQLTSRTNLEWMLGIMLDHLVEIFKISDRLEVSKAVLNVLILHNKIICSLSQHKMNRR